MAITDIDLTDIRLWVDDVPWDLFAHCRYEAPVHWSPPGHGPEVGGVWSVTRHADIACVGSDVVTFSPQRTHTGFEMPADVSPRGRQERTIAADPVRRDLLGAVVGNVFSARRLMHQAERIRGVVVTCLEELAVRDVADLVGHVAQTVPARVLGSLLGMPPADDQKLIRWTTMLAEFEQCQLFGHGECPAEGEVAAEFCGLREYASAIRTGRIVEPADDLLTTLVHAGVGGDRLTEAEFVELFVLLLSAGNLSIGASYTNTQIGLLRNPGQRDLVLDDMRLVPRAVEEALRMNPAVSCSARTATLDVELRGRQIAQGDRLLLWYLSGNRDETVFRSPDEFDMTRKELDHHLVFGVGGPQVCVGAWLARLELNTLVEETLRRFPRMRLIAEPVRVPSLFVNRPASVPVSLR